jgi:hypothetical protein
MYIHIYENSGLYRVFRLKSQSLPIHMNPFTHKTTKPITILNSCSCIPLLQLMDALLEIGTAVISAVCRSVSTCHRQTLPVSLNFVSSRCIVVLFGTSLSGYALLNASRTAANDFGAKCDQCSAIYCCGTV